MKGMDKKIKRAVSGTLAAVMAASAGIASFGAAGPERSQTGAPTSRSIT